jgi:cytochrome oxidase Cu insertion factor (SCO1/SenC/PrrC family)
MNKAKPGARGDTARPLRLTLSAPAFKRLRARLALTGLALALCNGQAVHALEYSLYSAKIKWTDDGGQSVTLDQWRGKPVLITMAYSNCRKICSVSMKKLEEFQKTLDERGQEAEIVVVSYDPVNDTPQAWRDYRSNRGLNRKNWHFLAGTERDTMRFAKLLGLDAYWSYHGHILHDFRISILDQNGVITRQVEWQDLRKTFEW